MFITRKHISRRTVLRGLGFGSRRPALPRDRGGPRGWLGGPVPRIGGVPGVTDVTGVTGALGVSGAFGAFGAFGSIGDGGGLRGGLGGRLGRRLRAVPERRLALRADGGTR